MKRIFSVLACVVLVFAMATVVMADNNVTVTATADTVYLGETVDVTVSVANAPVGTSANVILTVPACFEIQSGEWLLQNPTMQNVTGNAGVIAFTGETDMNGDIIKFTLKAVSADVQHVEAKVTFKNSNVGSDPVFDETGDVTLTASKKSITGVTVSGKSNLVYTGVAMNAADAVKITGTIPDGATITYEPATLEGAYYDNVKVTIEHPDYAKYEQSVLVNVAKAEAVISGVVAQDKAYDGTKDVTLEVTAETTVDGLLGNDGVTFDLVEGDTFTGLFADAEIGEDKPVVAVKDATQVLTGAAASNYNLVLATGVTADITKTAIVPTAVDYTDFSNVIITTATDTVEVNLNKSASTGVMVDNGATYSLEFKVEFINEADAAAYNDVVTIEVRAADVVTLTADPTMTLGTIDNLFETTDGYFIKGMSLVITATPIKNGYRVNRIEIGGKQLQNGDMFYFDPYDMTTSYTANAVFTKKTAVYPAPGTDKNIIEQTKSNKIVLTIGSTEATVFGSKKVNDVAPIIINDRTMLPARFVAEALGAKVEWDDAAKKVSIFKDMKKIEIYIGKAEAYINGQPVALDSPAVIQNSRTYMPVRFIAESLGANVKWNEATRQVVITK